MLVNIYLNVHIRECVYICMNFWEFCCTCDMPREGTWFQISMRANVFQRVAVCFSALQCVAMLQVSVSLTHTRTGLATCRGKRLDFRPLCVHVERDLLSWVVHLRIVAVCRSPFCGSRDSFTYQCATRSWLIIPTYPTYIRPSSRPSQSADRLFVVVVYRHITSCEGRDMSVYDYHVYRHITHTYILESWLITRTHNCEDA